MARSSRLLGSRSDRILVVDDESFIREGIELYFATEGYKVFVAANGEEALAVLGEQVNVSPRKDVIMNIYQRHGLPLSRRLAEHTTESAGA